MKLKLRDYITHFDGRHFMFNRNMWSVVLVLLLGLAMTTTLLAQAKLAQTGFEFLSVPLDARASAMGDAYTTVEGVSNNLFYNPAGIASITSYVDLAANYFDFIADIKYMSFSLAINPWQGQYGVFGLSLETIDYGEVEGTMVWANPQGFVDTEILEPKAIAMGLGYGKTLSDKFLVGGQVRWVSQQLGKSVIPGESAAKRNVTDALSFDFGTIYRTGFKSLSFGMSVRNFSQEIKFEEEGFQLPLTFKIGFSINALDFTNMNPDQHAFLLVLDAVHPRSYPEYINFGGEYTFMKMFSLRGGYISNKDEYKLTAGFGVSQFGLKIDYAYMPWENFDTVHRFTIRFSY